MPVGAWPGWVSKTGAAFPSPPNPQAKNSDRYTKCKSLHCSPDFLRGGTLRMDSTCCRQSWKIKEAWAADEGGTPTPSSQTSLPFVFFKLSLMIYFEITSKEQKSSKNHKENSPSLRPSQSASQSLPLIPFPQLPSSPLRAPAPSPAFGLCIRCHSSPSASPESTWHTGCPSSLNPPVCIPLKQGHSNDHPNRL